MKQLDFALNAAGRAAVNAIRKPPRLLLAMAPAAAGLLILAWAAAAIARAPWTPADGERLVLWLAMATVAAMSPIPIPWRAARLSWTAAVDLGTLLVFGPAVACWCAVVARLVGIAATPWARRSDHLARLGPAVCGLGAAGLVYALCRGQVGESLFIDAARLVAILTCGLTCVLVSNGLSALIPVVRHGQPLSAALGEPMRTKAAMDAAMLPFGILLAVAQIRVGSVAVAFFLLTLLLARYACILWIRVHQDHLAMTRALMAAVDAGDPFTRGHALRVSTMSARIARRMGLSAREVATIEYAALLHDLGRTSLRREVWQKPGKLSAKEYSTVQAHPRFGYDVLKQQAFFKGAAEIVYCHHEQPDGEGYPRGLRAGQIPIGSRIIMVVAAFDAMITDRPYRKGLSREAAIDELLAKANTQFFPEVVEHLITLYSTGELFTGIEDLAAGTAAEAEEEAAAPFGAPHSLAPRHPSASPRSPAGRPTPAIELPPSRLQTEIRLGANGARLLVAGLSDLGCTRENNEDSFGAFMAGGENGQGGLLVIADGMGGAAGGEVASGMAVETLSRVYLQSVAACGPQTALEAAMRSANGAIFFRARGDQRLQGMGTTCTAVAVAGNEIFLAHAGDSRAYLIQGGKIRQITQDHTLTAEIQRTMAGGSAGVSADMSHVLTRCLGNEAELEIDRLGVPVTLRAGDTLVLCSDGLSNMVAPEEIQRLGGAAAPEAACKQLVALARERGGQDNITVLAARMLAV
jgi:protein phosphatase